LPRNGAESVIFHIFPIFFIKWTMCIFRETQDVNTAESQQTMCKYLPLFPPPARLEVSQYPAPTY